MDKAIELINDYIKKIRDNYKISINKISEWQLNSFLDKKYSSKTTDEKRRLLIEKYLHNDIIFSTLLEDVSHLQAKKQKNLKILNIDDRMLESQGYSENKKAEIYQFISKLKETIEDTH